ncbi:MAG TPA: PKD domain-containing protein, partial [Terracidiphilus sp.]
SGPAKLSISRPRDFLNHASMLFLFAGSPPPAPPKGPNVKTYSPGIYHESLNPKSGDTIYLAPGSYFYGSLNLWQVDNVKVLGRGTIIYSGPQNPDADEGWMQKPDWHCVGSLEAHHIEVDGLTCILRSRTWSIQMKNSSDFVYDDLRVIGGNPGNANQDGMDWLGSSNGLVRNSFFRASDDVIALIGNWDGYTEADLLRPGPDVHDILIENSELSTSVSNIVRAGWPQKIFNSHGFILRNSDILHAGIGACVQHFGLIGFWGANGAKGLHQNYTFENLFLDNWYSLAQLEQEKPALKDFTFRNIWALDQPPLSESTIKGDISGVTFENVKYGQHVAQNNADLPLTVNSAEQPHYAPSGGPVAAFKVDSPIVVVNTQVDFTAQNSRHTTFTWYFGDGTQAHGRTVHHIFKDADGTDLDATQGAGRFRVMLQARDNKNREDWSAQGVVVVAKWLEPAQTAGQMRAGLAYQIFPGAFSELPDLKKETAVVTGESPNLNADARGFTRYAVAWDGLLDIPVDGGYTFHLMDQDGARFVLDGIEVARTGPPFANVCDTPGNATRYDRGSVGLRAGLHTIHVEQLI